MTIDDSHAAVAAQVRASGTSFYWPMRLQNRSYRQALFAIYMYCRELDDIADRPGDADNKRADLEQWRGTIRAMCSGHAASVETVAPLGPALAEVIARFGLPAEHFLALIDGMESDINGPIIAPDWETLSLYCQRVAGAVGHLCLAIWGWRGPEADLFASHTGEALQLTNILRDLNEDSRLGRLYLPQEALADADIKTRKPNDVLTHPNLARVCSLVADRARTHFNDAKAVWRRSSVPSARPAWVMLELYRHLFDAVERDGYGPDRPRTRLSTLRKLTHLIQAYVTA